jgi:hypothetical protein
MAMKENKPGKGLVSGEIKALSDHELDAGRRRPKS